MTRSLTLAALLCASVGACAPNAERSYAIDVAALADSAVLRAIHMDSVETGIIAKAWSSVLRACGPTVQLQGRQNQFQF